MKCPNCGVTLEVALAIVEPPPPPSPLPPPPPPPTAKFGLHVAGNKLVDQRGVAVQLRGVNRMSAEYLCVQGSGVFEGPVDQAQVDAMKAWKINVVRLPLNEHCWLGINGTPQGETYRAAVQDYVDRLVASGLYVILDLHWSAPVGQVARGQQAMPNTSFSQSFWMSVATRFKDNPAVLFDLFNEPIPNNNTNDDTDSAAAASWACWRDGGLACGTPLTRGYQPINNTQTVGMQALVSAVRDTGATNVIVLGGIQWANTIWSSSSRNILTYKPVDPLNQLVASAHIYEDTWARAAADWDREVVPVAAQMPVIFGEFGNYANDPNYITSVMNWADAHGVGYVAWVWFSSGEMRLANSDGSPTPYGNALRSHLL